MIMRKSLPVRQDQQKWVDILKADPTQPIPLINTFSMIGVATFVVLAMSVLSVIVLGLFLINRQPPQYIGLSTLAFSAIILLVLASIAFAALSVLKILRPYLFSMIWGISLAAFTVISILFVFFVGYEFVLWLVSPSNLQSSLQLGDQIFKFLIP